MAGVRRSLLVARLIKMIDDGDDKSRVLDYANTNLGRWGNAVVFGPCYTVHRACLLYGGTSPITLASAGVNVQTTARFLEGFGSSTEIDRIGGKHVTSTLDAISFVVPLIRALLPEDGRTAFWGHSAGGVLAECSNNICRVNGIGRSQEVITFGAPKPGTPEMQQEGDTEERIRWVNRGDPVPCLPFWGFNGGNPGLLVLFSDDYKPQEFSHPSGGRFLLRDGRWAECGSSVGNNIPSGIDVFTWFTGLASQEAAQHAIATYVRNLEAAEPNDTPESLPPIKPLTVEATVPRMAGPVIIPNAGNLVREFSVGRVDGNSLYTSNNPTPITIRTGKPKMAQSKIDKRLQATAVSGNGAYYVFWMEQQIMTAPSLGKARTIARGVNYMLRRLGKSSSVQKPQYEQALQSYLDAATTPGFGVTPPLVV